MNLNITPLSNIFQELSEISKFTEITMSEEPEEAVQRGNQLAVYMARTGKLLADAKYHRDRKLRSEVIEQLKAVNSMAPSVATKFVETLVENESHAVKWAERMNAACTNQLEWCRSVLSKAKAEMQAFGYGNHR